MLARDCTHETAYICASILRFAGLVGQRRALRPHSTLARSPPSPTIDCLASSLPARSAVFTRPSIKAFQCLSCFYVDAAAIPGAWDVQRGLVGTGQLLHHPHLAGFPMSLSNCHTPELRTWSRSLPSPGVWGVRNRASTDPSSAAGSLPGRPLDFTALAPIDPPSEALQEVLLPPPAEEYPPRQWVGQHASRGLPRRDLSAQAVVVPRLHREHRSRGDVRSTLGPCGPREGAEPQRVGRSRISTRDRLVGCHDRQRRGGTGGLPAASRASTDAHVTPPSGCRSSLPSATIWWQAPRVTRPLRDVPPLPRRSTADGRVLRLRELAAFGPRVHGLDRDGEPIGDLSLAHRVRCHVGQRTGP